MNNLYYIDYSELSNFKDHTTPIGIVIDMFQVHQENFNKFMIDLYEDKLPHNINKIIVKMDINQNTLARLNYHKDIFYMFYNEDDYYEEISNLDNDMKKQIIGAQVCSYGVQILKYRALGISNVFVASPFINDDTELNMLKSIGYNLYAVPNMNNSFGEVIDSNWIRPEGIKYYPSINNWILATSENSNINTIFSAYLEETWIGNIGDYLVNFNNSLNKYNNYPNILLPSFDMKRAYCKAECLSCNSCAKEFALNHKITNR